MDPEKFAAPVDSSQSGLPATSAPHQAGEGSSNEGVQPQHEGAGTYRAWYAGLMAALLLWGAWLAYGAYRFNHNPWRGVISLGCTLIFLEGWLILLGMRNRRMRQARGKTPLDPAPPG